MSTQYLFLVAKKAVVYELLYKYTSLDTSTNSNLGSKSGSNVTAVVLRQSQFYSFGPRMLFWKILFLFLKVLIRHTFLGSTELEIMAGSLAAEFTMMGDRTCKY